MDADLRHPMDWGFHADPNAQLNGRAIPYSMGKVLGGGSSVNVWTWSRVARQDQKGPVTTTEEARALLDELPLGKAKLMEFEFTELSPLTPLHLLIKEA